MKSIPLSFGGAYRAIADTNAAILYNPAGLGYFEPRISLAGDYSRIGLTDSNVFSISAIDAATLPGVPLAVEYVNDRPTIGTAEVSLQQLAVSSGVKLGEIMSVGATVKGFLTTTNSPLVDGPDGVDVDIGFLVKPIPLVSLAVTTQNIFLGQELQEFPFTVGVGAALNLDPHVRLAIDLTRDFQTASVNKVNSFFGGELRVAEGIFIRSGFGLDKVRQNNFYSVGFGLDGPKVKLQFVFSQRLNPTTSTMGGGIEFYL